MGHILVVCNLNHHHFAYINEGADLNARRYCQEDDCPGKYKPAFRINGDLVCTKGIPTRKGVKARYADGRISRGASKKAELIKKKRLENPQISTQELSNELKKLRQSVSNNNNQKMEQDDDDDGVTVDDKDDVEFIFGGEWNPDWRLTVSGTPYTSRDMKSIKSLVGIQNKKTSKLHTVTNNSLVRLSTDAAMGGSAVDAAKKVGRTLPSPKLAKQATNAAPAPAEEWCHLIAHSLGGNEDASNLVAASHACNTFMATIEAFLKSRSDLEIQVSAFCSAVHVAEIIKYEIFKNNVRKYCVYIDAQATAFTKEDQQNLKTELKKSVGKLK